MWEVWILLLQRFLQKPKSKRTFWKDSHKFRYFLFVHLLFQWNDLYSAFSDWNKGSKTRRHHLLWLWNGYSTEELVVAEDLLVSRNQISWNIITQRIASITHYTSPIKLGKKIAIRYCFSENVKAFYAGGWSYRGSLWSGTAGPCPTSRATEASPRGAQQTGNRLPTRPPGGRTECLPPAVQGRDTSGSQRSRCSSHTDQLPNTEMHKIQHHFNYQWKHT